MPVTLAVQDLAIALHRNRTSRPLVFNYVRNDRVDLFDPTGRQRRRQIGFVGCRPMFRAQEIISKAAATNEWRIDQSGVRSIGC